MVIGEIQREKSRSLPPLSATASWLPRLGARPAHLTAMLSALPALVYVLTQPRVGDFAAQTYRVERFGRLHFSVWDGNWYSGHHVPGYSVLFPPLGWLVGPAILAAVASVIAAAAFASLAEWQFGAAARPGSWWFATFGTASELFAGRLTFTLGLALALTSLLALQRGRGWAAAGLAVATALAGGVAALLLGLAAAALALARLSAGRRSAALWPAATGAAALAPALALFVLFPEGGSEPFYRPFFITTLGMTAALAVLLPRGTPRSVGIGVLLYAAGILASHFIATPVGSNVARFGTLIGGPLIACVLLSERTSVARRAPLAAAVCAYSLWTFSPWYELGALAGAAALLAGLSRRPTAPLWAVSAVVGLLPFLVWQWSQTKLDLSHAAHDPATHAKYFQPLLAFLGGVGGPRVWRVEVPPMREHWESVEVAARFPLARGWERQLDRRDASLFYRPHSWRGYHAWLEANAVRFVAVPDAPLDYSSGREIAAIRSRAPYLRLRWRSAHWRVYEVSPPPRLVVPEQGADIRARALGERGVSVLARTTGSALVRVRYTRYWRLRGGCVRREGDWTRITAGRTGRLSLRVSVTPRRLLPWSGERCG